jgi:hypothetical protein
MLYVLQGRSNRKLTFSEVCDHSESFCVSSFSLKKNDETESVTPHGVAFALGSARIPCARPLLSGERKPINMRRSRKHPRIALVMRKSDIGPKASTYMKDTPTFMCCACRPS